MNPPDHVMDSLSREPGSIFAMEVLEPLTVQSVHKLLKYFVGGSWAVLEEKCRVLAEGSRRRGREEEAEGYLELAREAAP